MTAALGSGVEAAGQASVLFEAWLYFLLAWVPWLAGLWVIYWLATLPWRRSERARVFLEVLELGCQSGRSPEESVVGASATQDPALPVRLHLVAARVEQGMRLDEALRHTPYFLSPEVQAMLLAGLQRNQLKAVLPACRELVAGRPDAGQGGRLAVGLFLILPGSTALVFLQVHFLVFPKLRQVMADLADGALPAVSAWVLDWGWLAAVGLLVLKAIVYLVVFSRTAGPRLGSVLPWHRLATWIPWRRRRLQRRFAHLLGLNLDLGVPEAEAVAAAAEGTGHAGWQRRAVGVQASLRSGVALSRALADLEPSGEFQWRLAMGLRHPGGVLVALRGWLEGLEERARRDEAVAAQTFFCVVILSNAALVGLAATAWFGMLTATVERMALW